MNLRPPSILEPPHPYHLQILPQEILGNAQAFCTSLNWASNLAVGLTFPAMLRALGIAGSYAVYCGLNLVGAALMQWKMVETKQRSLDEIQEELVGEEEEQEEEEE